MRRPSSRAFAVCASAILGLGLLSLPGAAGGASVDWTFAIYLCADNDLDAWAEMNTEQLMSIGSSDKVKFVAFWDPSTGPANMYLLEKGKKTELKDFAYNNKEPNMGDPDVLAEFASYLNSKLKADHLLIDLWDHGDDFRGICFDDTTGTADERDYLTHQEIVSALAGKHVDIIAADGCGIGTVEVAYEYAIGGIEAEWFVANENYVPLQGFPYDVIAKELVGKPRMSPEALSAFMVEAFADYYQKGWLTELAAIKLPAVPAMVDELWDVTSILSADMATYRGLVASGKGQATMGWSQYGWEAMVDFPTIFEVVWAGAPSGSMLKAEAAELLGAIAEAILYIGLASPADVWDPEGMSVFFPGSAGSMKNNVWWRGEIYTTMQFAHDGWLEFLEAYHSA